MRDGLDQQYRAVASGHWPLIRYDPVCARPAATRSCSTRPGRGCRWPTTRKRRAALPRAGRRRPGRGRAPARPRPAGRRPALAASTRRWRPAAPSDFPSDPRREKLMDLSTDYLGLALRNPLVASPSPLSYTLDGVRRLADGGVGAIVLLLAVRGAAARARRRATIAARRGRPPRASPRRSTTSRPWSQEDGRPAPLPEPARAGRLGGRRTCDREPQRRHPREGGPNTPARCRTPARPRSS